MIGIEGNAQERTGHKELVLAQRADNVSYPKPQSFNTPIAGVVDPNHGAPTLSELAERKRTGYP